MPAATAATAATVLIVEDDPGIAALELDRLEEAGYRCVVTPGPDEALEALAAREIDLILLDYRLPGGADGLDFYARAKAAGHNQPVILVTAYSNEATVIQALRVGVRDFVTKSLEYLDYLPDAVARVLGQVRTEHQLAGIIESAQDAIICAGADKRVTLFNPAAERMFGLPAREALGRPVAEFVPAEPSAHGANGPGTWGVRAGGDRFPVEVSVSRGEDGGQRFYTFIVRDVTARVAAEEALRQRDRAIREVTQGILITDALAPDDPIVYTSPGFERLTGYAAHEVLGRNCRILQGKDTDPAAVARLRAALRTGRPCTVELLNYRKDGSTFWNELSISPVRDDSGRVTQFVGVQTDVTRRRELEAQFLQAQKMEAVGQLAGGIAHDFNNLLTVINGFSELALRQMAPDDPNRACVTEVRDAGERATRLTRKLLTFSRKEVVAPTVLDLNALTAGAGGMLRWLLGESVRLVLRTDPHLDRVRADPGHIEQVIMNLAVNARDAMPRGGTLTIATANVVVGDGGDGRPAGRYVRLSVADTGVGMTDEVRAKMFEPFFTTKGVGQGTGLGLATVYGIVTQSGGYIDVTSAVGAGSTFEVYFPSAGSGASLTPTPAAAAPARPARGTVLVTEDDDRVRRLTREALQQLGYAVLDAPSGEEALRVCANPEVRIDLLLTDVVLPGMGGRELAEAAARLRPGLKVLYVSGYADDAVVRHGVLRAETAFLQKPFTTEALGAKVRDVLG